MGVGIITDRKAGVGPDLESDKVQVHLPEEQNVISPRWQKTSPSGMFVSAIYKRGEYFQVNLKFGR